MCVPTRIDGGTQYIVLDGTRTAIKIEQRLIDGNEITHLRHEFDDAMRLSASLRQFSRSTVSTIPDVPWC